MAFIKGLENKMAAVRVRHIITERQQVYSHAQMTPLALQMGFGYKPFIANQLLK